MDIVALILMFLASVVLSSFIARAAAPWLPAPVVQIGLGGALAAAFQTHLVIDPDLFLLLFITPLLFLDGWRMPREGLFRDRRTICALAFGLVFFTVAVAGPLIHAIIPALPLPVAFAIAAVLSPTDAVAVSAITARAPLPTRLMHILEGEALLNDASGLVCMRFAIVAALAGKVSILGASGVFVWLCVGGLGVGVLTAWLANFVKDAVARRFGEETGAQILVSLLIPFVAYLAAAQVQASGILAAVGAGVAMSYEERAGNASPLTRIRRAAVWDAIRFAGNGVIFILLGHELPGIAAGAAGAVRQSGHGHIAWLALYVAAVFAVLVGLRGVWVWGCLRLGPRRDPAHRRLVMVATLAGVRGAVGLSAVMALPLVLADGAPLPGRDLAIFLVAGVIVLSLILANLALPALAARLATPPDLAHRAAEHAARLHAAEAAIAALQADHAARGGADEDPEIYAEVHDRLVDHYRRRLGLQQRVGGDVGLGRRASDIERRLRLLAFRAERDAVYRESRAGTLEDEVADVLVHEVDLLEARASAPEPGRS